MTHGDHKNKWSQEPEVTDEMTSQQSVKYGEEKVEKGVASGTCTKTLLDT